MPKKHHKTTFVKPASTVHHTLISSGSRNNQNDRFRSSQASSSTTETPSVNDLINHLRRTQVSRTTSEDSPGNTPRFVAPRSVHPSLRNLLEIPETPPPRPRPDSRRAGVINGRRVRRTPGPPAPESWLLGSNDTDTTEESDLAADMERVIYRLERLPGTTFPRKDGLLHVMLKSMASHWAWHLEYDGTFLSLLPSHVKVLLLSYIAIYARDQPLRGMMQGLKPLFEKPHLEDHDRENEDDLSDLEISRLDLGGALGRWMTLKQLSSELLISYRSASGPAVQRKLKESVPTSWEEEYDEESESTTESPVASLPKSLSQGLRFENLRFLSLAHPKPTAANWNSLVDLLARLSTLTHLSLAHWPAPTVTPNAINARVRHPAHRSLVFAYGGTDSYSAMENNWAEAAGVLRRLSRATYCLKWLDLEGCGDWIPALNWEGVGPDGEAYSAGPEWNRSWRDIESIRLGPGWLPHIEDDEVVSRHEHQVGPAVAPPSSSLSPPRSLAFSIHAPARAGGIPSDGASDSDLPWDVEEERIKYRRSKELERYREIQRSAKAVQNHVLRTRKEGRGKWVQFSFGLEGLDYHVFKKLLGSDYSSSVP